MNVQLISMLLSLNLTYAFGIILYSALFSYSFKRRQFFILRVICSVLGIGTVSMGVAFALYAILDGIYGNVSFILYVDLLRAGSYMLYTALGAIAITVCFEEKASLTMFALVAASAALTISNALYNIVVDVFRLSSVFFTMYNGADVWSFVAFGLINVFVLIMSWFLFARSFARMQKDFGKSVNNFVIGLYVLYAFFTAGISGSQFFNMTLMGIESTVIPLIFNGFSAFFAGFVLFVQRFNLLWMKDVQHQEAAESFHSHYKVRMDKQQANMALISQRIGNVKEQIAGIISKYDLSSDVLDELNAVSMNIFDSGIQTGNDALDVLLTQKALKLNALGIKTTATIEGKALSFMDVSDVNVFFGNAIDNAMDYLETVDEEKRFIRISSTRNRSLLMVRIENYCEKDISFTKDGRPHSSITGSQGYGTYSIRAVAEKYGGTAVFTKEGDLFVMVALFSSCEPF